MDVPGNLLDRGALDEVTKSWHAACSLGTEYRQTGWRKTTMMASLILFCSKVMWHEGRVPRKK